MAAKNKPEPDTPSRAWERLAPKWRMIEALLGGTDAMKAAGTLYLPRYEEETPSRYKSRLEKSVLLNMTKFTLNNMVGRVFRKPLRFAEDVAEAVREWSEDADGAGNALQVVCYDWFKTGFGKGLAHVLVDFPQTPKGAPTLAETAGQRPYWTLVAPENLLYARSVKDPATGREVLVEARVLEEWSEPDGWGETCGLQVRVLTPGAYQVLRKKVNSSKRGEWYVFEEGATRLDFVPLVTFYTGRKDFMVSDLPLEDLAQLNIAHWRSTSDQNNVLTAARFPILAVSGGDAEDGDGKKLKIGPYNLLSTMDPQGRFYYVEHNGAAIAAGRQDMRDLEDVMASYGAQFLKKRADIESATGRILDSTETISELQAITLNFKDAVELALQYTARWLGLDDGGSVSFESYVDLVADGGDLQALQEARRNRDISRETFLSELRRRNVLADDFSAAKDLELLAEENSLGVDETAEEPGGDGPEGGTKNKKAGGDDEGDGGEDGDAAGA
jgi:hypothetical protein